MALPPIKISELARETGLNPLTIFRILTDNPNWVPQSKDGMNPILPQSSKNADRIQAAIEEEGQRYCRRFQFPNGGSKTTRGRIRQRIIKAQIERTRIIPRTTDLESPDKKRNVSIGRFGFRPDYSAEVQVDKILSSLVSNSVMPPQRPQQIKQLFYQALTTGEPVMILNWICPAGKPLQPAPDDCGVYRSYVDIDPKQGFENDYRLLPRIAAEKKLISTLERFGLPYWYIKLVADDNPWCLYPYCLQKDGQEETMKAIRQYAQYIQDRLDQEFGDQKIQVFTESEFFGNQAFQKLVNLFGLISIEQLTAGLSANAVKTEMDVIAKHTRMSESLLPRQRLFTEAVIRQYAVEGAILREVWGDNLVLAWNESTRRTQTVDALLKVFGQPAFPKIFVLYNTENGIIKDNF